MAISARTAQLLNQRSRLGGGYASGGRRVLAPKNNPVNSIAKSTVSSELSAMVKRYNDGIVGNAEMKNFLDKVANTPGVSNSDRVQVEDMMRDFDFRIAKDNLEMRYKSAPDKSIDKILAAQQLASFYTSRANSMEPNTPAQSQAMENAANWTNTAQQETDKAEKYARSLRRAQMEQEVNRIPSSSSEQSMAKAKMYQELYNQALTDGDTLEANRFMASANMESTRAQERAQREQDQAEKAAASGRKTEVINYLNTLANQYHDGLIDERSYLESLSKIDPIVTEMGDTALALKINSLTDKIAKNLSKGGINRALTESGLMAVTGAGSTATNNPLDSEQFEYDTTLRKLQEAFRNGEIPPEKYSEIMGEVVSQHAKTVDLRVTELEQLAQDNPYQKIYFQGSKRKVSDVLDEMYKESDIANSGLEAAQNGTFGIVEVPPSQFSKTGDVSKGGRRVSTYQVVDTRNMPADQYTQGPTGIYHKINKETAPLSQAGLTPEEMQMAISNRGFSDAKGNWIKVTVDSSGNPEYETGNRTVDIYTPGSAERQTVPFTGTLESAYNPVAQKMVTESGQVPMSSEAAAKSYASVQKNKNVTAPVSPQQLNTQPTQSASPTAAVKPDFTQPQQASSSQVVPAKTIAPAVQSSKPVNIPLALPGLTRQPTQSATPIPTVKDLSSKMSFDSAKPVNISLATPTPGLQLQPIQTPKPVPQQNILQQAGQAIGQNVSKAFDFFKKKLKI